MENEETKEIDPLLKDDDEGQPNMDELEEKPAVEEKEISSQPASEDQSKAEPPIVAKKTKKVSANEAKNKDIIAETKEILAKGPHTNFIIPLAEGEAVGSFETVQINGYKLTIQKGTMVNIPVSVANILAEKYRIAMTAGQDKKVDRAPDVQDALN